LRQSNNLERNARPHNMTDTFRTERLIAERLGEKHLAELVVMHQTPKVMATLGGVRSEAVTAQYLADNLEHWQRYEFGLWIFRDLNGAFAGRGGIRHLLVEERDEVELAYSLMGEFWGKGLATEMATALVRMAFEQYNLPDLVALALTTNKASRRVMEKLGFRYKRDVSHGGFENALYRLPNPHPLQPLVMG
jgi:[ribosomal protein S5]-alanine N-acetyltransferase